MEKLATTAPPTGSRPPIADVIREAIRQRLFEPGQPLIQASIADALGVSRIPVREALHALAAEGLVTFGEDGGARVTALSSQEVDELWTLRGLLESQMAPGIVRNATPEDIDVLEATVHRMDDLAPSDWLDENYALHQELARVSGMPHFAAATNRVLLMIEPYSRMAVTVLQAQPDAQAEHHAMVGALRAGDADELARLLAHHSNRARSVLLDYTGSRASLEEQRVSAAEAARSLATRLGSGK
jgi:DNA-binding GntR family transcriptional regulator